MPGCGPSPVPDEDNVFLLKNSWQGYCIWSTIRNEYMSAIYPIGTMPAQIVVREEDYEKAKAMLHHR